MRQLELTREPSTDQGTFGHLAADGFKCATVELPNRENASNKSCIPLGKYLCEMDVSPRYGRCYHVRAVPGRDAILIHAANVAGDVDKGYVSQLQGCIALGSEVVLFHAGTKLNTSLTLEKTQRGVSASGPTLAAFRAHMKDEPFELMILGRQI